MYNDASIGTLAATGGASSLYLGWWALVLTVLGIAALMVARKVAKRRRRALLEG